MQLRLACCIFMYVGQHILTGSSECGREPGFRRDSAVAAVLETVPFVLTESDAPRLLCMS